MAQKQIIVVAGATGAQGGGLVRAALRDGNNEFVIRALTRKPESDKAKALADLGAEVVAADLDDAGSLREAFDGAYGAYCVTNFWEHFSPDKETTQAQNMAHAARDAGLKHVIWSTLEDVRQWYPLTDDSMPTLMGSYKVPHFDGKGAADHFFADLGVPTTFLRAAFYWENLIYFGMGPQKCGDSELTFTMPLGEGKLPGIGAEDIGKCAYGMFKTGQRCIGQTIGVAGENLTGTEMAAALSRKLGAKVRFQDLRPADYRALGFPGAEDLGNMFQFQLEHNEMFCAARSVEDSKRMNPELLGFADWLSVNGDRIPLT